MSNVRPLLSVRCAAPTLLNGGDCWWLRRLVFIFVHLESQSWSVRQNIRKLNWTGKFVQSQNEIPLYLLQRYSVF